MNRSLLPSALPFAAALSLAGAAHADVVWTGAVDDDIFDEANWDLTNSTVTVIDENVPIFDDIVIANAPAPVMIAGTGAFPRFEIGDGFTMTIDNSTVVAPGFGGIGSSPGAAGVNLFAVNGTQLTLQYIVNQTALQIDGTSTAKFKGGDNPINLSFVDLLFGCQLEFTNETPAQYLAEHLVKTTVNGQPAVDGVNISVTPAGATGCRVEVLQATLGSNYCTAALNSSGFAAVIEASGSSVASDNDLTLSASGLPPMQFGIFVTSRTQASTPVASGILCVGGQIVRFQGPGQILQASPAGEYELDIDTTTIPLGGVPTPIMAGETWNFTTWFRDVDPMIGNTANFSDGVAIPFI